MAMDITSEIRSINPDENGTMNPNLYRAAVEGNIEPFKETSIQLDLAVTPIKTTVLHLNIPSQNVSTKFVEEILNLCPSLLLQVNVKGETPLHVAAKWGHATIVRVLIQHAKDQHEDLEIGIGGLGAARQMLRMTNNEGNTALHEAVQHNKNHVVGILTQEDPDFSYSANHCHETPLYIAVLRGSLDMVVHILDNCTSSVHGGPDGKTALHEAVIYNRIETIRVILEREKSLTKETDNNGWTPLHYAAYYGHITIMKELLEVDVSVAYKVDKQRNMTPLHMAAGQGHITIMNKIILYCPDCCELVDNRGWNVLHFAMASLTTVKLRTVLQNQLLWNLRYAKDINGNTPFHVLDLTHEDTFVSITQGNYFGGGYLSLNKLELGFMELRVLRRGSLELQKKLDELYRKNGPYLYGVIRVLSKLNKGFLNSYEKARDWHLVVAALIATVTFATSFTLPGGYKSDEGENHRGTANLTRECSFQAFVITNSIAMVLSLSAVLFHFVMARWRFRHYLFLFNLAYIFTILAMIAMAIAFITGTYAVLSPSIGLAIATCLIGIGFLVVVLLTMMWVISVWQLFLMSGWQTEGSGVLVLLRIVQQMLQIIMKMSNTKCGGWLQQS